MKNKKQRNRKEKPGFVHNKIKGYINLTSFLFKYVLKYNFQNNSYNPFLWKKMFGLKRIIRRWPETQAAKTEAEHLHGRKSLFFDPYFKYITG